MYEGTMTVTSGPQRYNSNPVMSRANECDQHRSDSHSLDGMQEVRGSNPLSSTPTRHIICPAQRATPAIERCLRLCRRANFPAISQQLRA
jgi:hypothetical protein